MKTDNFDESMAKRVSCYLNSINDTSEHVLQIFGDPLTLDELKVSMKQASNTNSLIPDGFHVKMIKNLVPIAKTFLLVIHNRCWDHAVWPWSLSRLVFIGFGQ